MVVVVHTANIERMQADPVSWHVAYKVAEATGWGHWEPLFLFSDKKLHCTGPTHF